MPICRWLVDVHKLEVGNALLVLFVVPLLHFASALEADVLHIGFSITLLDVLEVPSKSDSRQHS